MAEDWPSENPRRDIFMFLGFVGLCLTAVAIVAIANASPWTEKQWTAVAAFGSIAQAVGVFGALIYASQQIRVAHDAGVRQRIEALSDRLESVTHAELHPAIQDLAVAWNRFESYVSFWHTADGGADPGLQHSDRLDAYLRDSYATARDEFSSAHHDARKASNAAMRAMRALGHGKILVVYQVDIGVMSIDRFMPINITDVTHEQLSKNRHGVDELQARTADFIKWVDAWIEENAPSSRRT